MLNSGLNLLPYGVVLLQAGVFIILLCLLFARENNLIKWLGRNAVFVSTVLVVAAVAGSEFYSLVAGFDPCLLCWWQRVFLFPQLIIFIIALRKSDTGIFKYTTPLSIIGGLIATYHILLPKLIELGVSEVCNVGGVSCTKLYVNAFGYITIPVMSLTVFVSLILVAISYKQNHEK